ncbi:MAG: hypothetical protein G01um101438_657 [Parcubacteria group bacterium Gr01-1014_38]|nr:MAG: hypothetical protein G01um101438_657 [Parcubacteria group bacterium Gr01-1014_38]
MPEGTAKRAVRVRLEEVADGFRGRELPDGKRTEVRESFGCFLEPRDEMHGVERDAELPLDIADGSCERPPPLPQEDVEVEGIPWLCPFKGGVRFVRREVAEAVYAHAILRVERARSQRGEGEVDDLQLQLLAVRNVEKVLPAVRETDVARLRCAGGTRDVAHRRCHHEVVREALGEKVEVLRVSVVEIADGEQRPARPVHRAPDRATRDGGEDGALGGGEYESLGHAR